MASPIYERNRLSVCMSLYAGPAVPKGLVTHHDEAVRMVAGYDFEASVIMS